MWVRFGLAALVAMISTVACTAPSAPDPSAGPPAVQDVVDAVETPPWIARLELERVIAERDPRHQPARVEGGVVLSPPSGMVTRVGSDGASVTVGESSLELGVVAVGREGRAVEIERAAPTIVGPEVQRRLAPGVTEWWRSLSIGIEHGVTLDERPSGTGPLRIDVRVQGLEAHPRAHDPNGVVLTTGEGAQVAAYAHLAVLDADGRLVPATMRVVDSAVRIEVEDGGARYPLVVDPLVVSVEDTLNAMDAANGDEFGTSVAISADGTRAIVGAPNDAPDNLMFWIAPGTARVFRRSGGAWTEEQMLAPSSVSGDWVGAAVAISADGTRVLIGAPHTSSWAGAAYVFSRPASGTTWTQEGSALLAESPAANDLFGWAVSLTADASRAIVGARDDTTAYGVEGGSAVVFTRTGTTWAREQTLIPVGDGEALERFGVSVAISGDGTRAIVGARLDTIGTPPAPAPMLGSGWQGSARVFVRSGSAWTQEVTLRSPTPVINAQFGFSVALTNDADRAIVGAHYDDLTGTATAGTAHIYRRASTTWTHEVQLEMSSPGANDEFGTSVSIASDGSRAVISAVVDDTSAGVDAGSARVFVRTGTSWANETTLVSPVPAVGDHFGESVSMTADGTRVIVGAPKEEPPSGAEFDNQGGAHVFIVGAPLSPDGTACSAASTCASGNCVDGFCCESACGAGSTSDCRSCAASATGAMNGQCRPVSAGTVCRSEAPGGCDVAEVCDGSAIACPSDGFEPTTTECRPAVPGGCDVPEMCPGDSATCPSDAVADPSTVCRPAMAGGCDIEETCDGSTTICPADVVQGAGTICRPEVGSGCDVAETCDGSANTCPADALRPSGATCRGTAGLCDVAETCSGVSADCPRDRLRPGGAVCRVAMGTCDVAETCSGGSPTCPIDGVASPSLVCRPSAGACDPAETCDGRGTACPPDAYAAPGTVCRSAPGVCDVAETCGGLSPTCPADASAPDGTSCSDALVCNGDEICVGGSCSAGAAPSCDDADMCTADMCAEPAGCSSAPIAGCCNIDSDCADGDACTVNSCTGPGGTCTASPITDCCLVDMDCDDMNVCTAEVCDTDTNRCVHTAVPGCCAMDADCDDMNACSLDTCDVASGACSNVEIAGCCLTDGDCDDTNTCTMDACDVSSNTCTNDALAGCCLTDAECADANACTADSCNPATAACVNDTIEGCCSEDTDCDDVDECTADRCDTATSTCVFEPIGGCGETDAGVSDAGTPDAGDPLDAGGAADAAAELDAGAPADGSTADAGTGPMDGGCGCRVEARGGAPIGWLVLLGGLLFVRRRR